MSHLISIICHVTQLRTMLEIFYTWTLLVTILAGSNIFIFVSFLARHETTRRDLSNRCRPPAQAF